MSSSFTNAAVVLSTTSRTDLYTAPALTKGIIHNLTIANIDGVNTANVTIEFYDASATTYYKLAYLVPVPGGATLIFDKPINLETGDKVSITADTASRLSAFASVMQIA